MPKTFLDTLNKGDMHHWEFPTYQVTINTLNSSVLQELLKIPGVELVDVQKIATNRPPVIEAEMPSMAKRMKEAKSAEKKPKAKPKPKGNRIPFADRFYHPSGKPAHHFLAQFLSDNGGPMGLAELKRMLKVEGFEPGTAMGAITKMVARGEAIKVHPRGYALTDKGKERVRREEHSGQVG
jgi:hypothetical protein